MHLRNPNGQHNRDIDHLVEELHDSGHVNDFVQEMDDLRELQLRNPHSYLYCLDPGTVIAQRARQPPQELNCGIITVFCTVF